MNAARKPSQTAQLIAAASLLGAEAGLRERVARAALQACGSSGRRLLAAADTAFGRGLLRALEYLTLPGLSAHYRWRKRRIANWVDAQLRQDVRELIVLGSGFDSLGLAAAKANSTLCVLEVDHPSTLGAKRAALASLGEWPDNLRLVDADLAEPDAFARALGARKDEPSLVVAEGVLMYLPPPGVLELAQTLRRLRPGPLNLIATAMATDAQRRPCFRRQRGAVNAWLGWVGERFRWGVEREQLAPRLAALEFDLIELADPEAPDDPDPSPGEWLLHARAAPRTADTLPLLPASLC